jgi:hypothetical protein
VGNLIPTKVGNLIPTLTVLHLEAWLCVGLVHESHRLRLIVTDMLHLTL